MLESVFSEEAIISSFRRILIPVDEDDGFNEICSQFAVPIDGVMRD